MPGNAQAGSNGISNNPSMMMTMSHQQQQEQKYWDDQNAPNSFMNSYNFQQQSDRKRARGDFQ